MLDVIKSLVRDEEGQGMVEYGLIIALVSVVVIAALALMGDYLNLGFKAINTELLEVEGID